MKTAYLLFGLASAAACERADVETQYPLCDREGAPACGNIGQVGRAEKTAPAMPALQPARAQQEAATARLLAAAARLEAATAQLQPAIAPHAVEQAAAARQQAETARQLVETARQQAARQQAARQQAARQQAALVQQQAAERQAASVRQKPGTAPFPPRGTTPATTREQSLRDAPMQGTLVGASQASSGVGQLQRPLLGHRGEVVCGNVMGKGGRRRVCRDATRTTISETDIDHNGNAESDPFASGAH